MIVMLTEQVWLKVLYMVWIGNVQSLLEIDKIPAHSFNKYDDCHVDWPSLAENSLYMVWIGFLFSISRATS